MLTGKNVSEEEVFFLWWLTAGHHPGSKACGDREEAAASGRDADTWPSCCCDCWEEEK